MLGIDSASRTCAISIQKRTSVSASCGVARRYETSTAGSGITGNSYQASEDQSSVADIAGSKSWARGRLLSRNFGKAEAQDQYLQ